MLRVRKIFSTHAAFFAKMKIYKKNKFRENIKKNSFHPNSGQVFLWQHGSLDQQSRQISAYEDKYDTIPDTVLGRRYYLLSLW
jgi:hypothetical protein